jgi:hypothetical protein
MKYIIHLLIIVACTSCTKVSPWEKEYLAKPNMAFDPDPIEAQFRNHVYQSKEGASGGYGINIGACGCN